MPMCVVTLILLRANTGVQIEVMMEALAFRYVKILSLRILFLDLEIDAMDLNLLQNDDDDDDADTVLLDLWTSNSLCAMYYIRRDTMYLSPRCGCLARLAWTSLPLPVNHFNQAWAR